MLVQTPFVENDQDDDDNKISYDEKSMMITYSFICSYITLTKLVHDKDGSISCRIHCFYTP